jgi:hypothetical protein
VARTILSNMRLENHSKVGTMGKNREQETKNSVQFDACGIGKIPMMDTQTTFQMDTQTSLRMNSSSRKLTIIKPFPSVSTNPFPHRFHCAEVSAVLITTKTKPLFPSQLASLQRSGLGILAGLVSVSLHRGLLRLNNH